MKQDRKDTLYIVTGALLLLVAALLLNLAPAQEQPLLRVLPFLCLGVGAGLLGQGVGQLLQRKALQGNPELARQQQIEVEDERNIQLAQRAKAKAFDLMIFVFGALLLAFALMQVDLTAILLLVGAYLLVQGYAVYCRVRLEKEM
ncbi:MAG TPA: hypothetical protein K8V20_07105 [Subdoligranulum variabile]|uniref:DUF2178 domain-containing protein n=1 Tax=Subdoligranulum variabile TaxID=214851 RepID=A0A921IKA0_9FIRM|nr:hypothetical protein [Subdoligranulum variabile]